MRNLLLTFVLQQAAFAGPPNVLFILVDDWDGRIREFREATFVRENKGQAEVRDVDLMTQLQRSSSPFASHDT